MISTRDLSQLPDIPLLRSLCQSLAMLEAILRPDERSRCHWFFAAEEQAYMDDGGGNTRSVFFTREGAIITGFDHEADTSPYRTNPQSPWPGVWDDFPAEFASFLAAHPDEPLETTFCIWRRTTDTSWQRGRLDFPEGPDPDGSVYLLRVLDGRPETYQQWVQDFRLVSVDLAAVQHIYEHRPLSAEIVHQLNREANLADAQREAHKIGYPAENSIREL